MARLVAAFGSSHSVMLTSQLEGGWVGGFEERDKKITFYNHDGDAVNYDQVLAEAPANALEIVTDDAIRARFHQTQAAMDRMKQELDSVDLDVLVIVGDDQHELFKDEYMPAMGIFYGKSIVNAKSPDVPPEQWYRKAQMRRLEDDAEKHYPVDSKLALYMIEQLVEKEFDVTAVKSLDSRKFESHPYEGHAFSFIHRRYLKGRDLPVVPVFLNTYNPPNPPTPKRCVKLGLALREVIESYPEDIKVGVMASGGLSHFTVEEKMDREILDAVARGDLDYLGNLSPKRLQSGSSEIRNWIVATAAAKGMKVTWQDYVPGYRTPALTGTGLGFTRWSW